MLTELNKATEMSSLIYTRRFFIGLLNSRHLLSCDKQNKSLFISLSKLPRGCSANVSKTDEKVESNSMIADNEIKEGQYCAKVLNLFIV